MDEVVRTPVLDDEQISPLCFRYMARGDSFTSFGLVGRRLPVRADTPRRRRALARSEHKQRARHAVAVAQRGLALALHKGEHAVRRDDAEHVVRALHRERRARRPRPYEGQQLLEPKVVLVEAAALLHPGPFSLSPTSSTAPTPLHKGPLRSSLSGRVVFFPLDV
jgi:hypothetical protein